MKKLHLEWFVVALAASVGWAQVAHAQEESGGEDAVDAAIEDAIEDAPPVQEAPAQEPTAGAPAGVAPAATAQAAAAEEPEAEEALDPDSKLYWAELRDVHTMQQRAFLKSGRLGVTVYGGLIPNNIFEKYYPVGARINYFILENIGVELAGSYAFKSETNLEPLITESSGIGAQQVLIGDTQVSHTNFGIVWSPFYGKAAFYNTALSYFDIFLFAGVGLVITETTPEFNAEPEQEFKPEGALGAGMSFFMGDHFALRADFRQFVFQKVQGIGGVANPSEVSLGLSYFF